MKIFLIILGTILIALGVCLMFGSVLFIIEGSIEEPLSANIAGLIFGLIPAALGGFFIHKALEKK